MCTGRRRFTGIVADPQKTAVAAFNALGEAWLEDPNPSPFIEFWLYNHPSVRTPRQFCAALRSVGERGAWGVLLKNYRAGNREQEARKLGQRVLRVSEQLEDAGGAHAAADAHGDHAVARLPALSSLGGELR